MTQMPSIQTLQPALKADIYRVFALQQQHQYEVAATDARARMAKLRRLQAAILAHRAELEDAMWADLRKNKTEVALTELAVVSHEIRHTLDNLQSWMTAKKVGAPLTLFRTHSEIVYEPKGVCLILAPWNFPFTLTFDPLVSAIAAGNCVVLKPSEFSPHTNVVMRKIVSDCFPPGEVSFFEGDATVAQELLSLPFNHIFFTGSPKVGKIVMRAAAEHLASVTLELGGKSPVIVDETANLDTAAAKIIWIKIMNAGQICISPDYVLVHRSRHDALLQKLTDKIKQFYGQTPEERQKSPDICRMIEQKHYNRVKNLLDDALHVGAKISIGGEYDEHERYLAPTVLHHVPVEAKIWEEEIFGPLLPVRSFDDLDQAIALVNSNPKPLALYIFANDDRRVQKIIRETRSGGVSVNDCGAHFYNLELPFGGSNNSGIGKCHGVFGFLEFTNQRSVLYQAKWLPTTDWFLPPYGGKLRAWLLEGVIKWF